MSAILTKRGHLEPNPMIEDGHTRRPVNRQTAIVVSGGVTFSYNGARHVAGYGDEWKSPPPVTEPRQGVKSMRGIRFGRFVVVGYLRRTAKKQQVWLVRCSCGVYCARNSAAIQNPSNDIDSCSECRNLVFLKRAQHRTTTGKWLDPREFA